MGYIEEEIEEEKKLNNIKGNRLDESVVSDLVTRINSIFFDGSSKFPDPVGFKCTKKYQDSEFWNKVNEIATSGSPIFGVFDKKVFFWSFETSTEIKRLLSETTGFPFWITDENLSFLIYFDDHDCVHEAFR